MGGSTTTVDLVLLANVPAQAESLLHNLDYTAKDIGLYVNPDETEFMCCNQDGAISSLNAKLSKLVDQFIYLGSNITSPESECQHMYW